MSSPMTSSVILSYQVPWTYIWSPSLVPKPKDWPENCEVVGFINVELKKLTQYEPDQALKDFLAAGDHIGYRMYKINGR